MKKTKSFEQVCKEECVEEEALRAHLRLHLADFPFHCGLCHFTTEQRDDLRSHMQSKHLHQLKVVQENLVSVSVFIIRSVYA